MRFSSYNLLSFSFQNGCGKVIEKQYHITAKHLSTLIRLDYYLRVSGKSEFTRSGIYASGLLTRFRDKLREFGAMIKGGILKKRVGDRNCFFYSFTDYGDEIINSYREEVEKRIAACNKRILGSLRPKKSI